MSVVWVSVWCFRSNVGLSAWKPHFPHSNQKSWPSWFLSICALRARNVPCSLEQKGHCQRMSGWSSCMARRWPSFIYAFNMVVWVGPGLWIYQFCPGAITWVDWCSWWGHIEALLVMRRSCSGTRVSSGCLSWANRVGDKCLPVFWPPILISRPFAKVACHPSFGLAGACKCPVVPCLGMSGVGMPPPIGRTCLFGSRINVGVASGFSCSDVSVAANFVTYTGFGRVGTLGWTVALRSCPEVTTRVTWSGCPLLGVYDVWLALPAAPSGLGNFRACGEWAEGITLQWWVKCLGRPPQNLVGNGIARDIQNVSNSYPCRFHNCTNCTKFGKGGDICIAVFWFVIAPRWAHLTKLEPKSVSKAPQNAYRSVWLDRSSSNVLFSIKDHIRSMSSRQLHWKEPMAWTGSLNANLEVVCWQERHADCAIIWTWLATVSVELRASSPSHVTDDILELLTLLPINNRSSRVDFNNQSSIYYMSYYAQQLDATKRCLLWSRGCAFLQGVSMPGMLWRLSGVNYLESCALRHVPPDFKSSFNWGNLIRAP